MEISEEGENANTVFKEIIAEDFTNLISENLSKHPSSWTPSRINLNRSTEIYHNQTVKRQRERETIKAMRDNSLWTKDSQ